MKKFKYLNSKLPLVSLLILLLQLNSCSDSAKVPIRVKFKSETIKRIGWRGDNWCITWVKDGSQITSMDDGNWLEGENYYHNYLYRILGDANNFTREEISGYPKFLREKDGWFGYGIYSIDGSIYSLVSKTKWEDWSGPFRGIKMLKSIDNGNTWYRINQYGEEQLLKPEDELRDSTNINEMFFMEEFGITRDSITAYPFSFCSFVQNGKANKAAKDDYVYIYSPEGSYSNNLLLAFAHTDSIEHRGAWQYFNGWDNENPSWTNNISDRKPVYVFPKKNNKNEYFGWYSWLPSVVWNEGLRLYIMVNGGTYAGYNMTSSAEDYFKSWMHTKTGSLGFWYSENPYGPWEQFYYEDYWIADDENNLTYQPKLSPKWINKDGTKMVLIWSDAMKNKEGKSHTVNYLWNQMEIEIILE